MISSEGVQNEGNGCPKWVCCSAVRAGRKGSEYLSRSESATPGSGSVKSGMKEMKEDVDR